MALRRVKVNVSCFLGKKQKQVWLTDVPALWNDEDGTVGVYPKSVIRILKAQHPKEYALSLKYLKGTSV